MSSDDYLASHPHCLLAYRWITAWLHLLYFLSDRSPLLQEYHEFFSQAHTPDRLEHDLSECVRHFFRYFVTLENIDRVANRTFSCLTPNYGGAATLPLHTLVEGMSERDQEIFRTFTLDVYLSVADPVIAAELGIVPTLEEEYWFSNVSKP